MIAILSDFKGQPVINDTDQLLITQPVQTAYGVSVVSLAALMDQNHCEFY